MAALVRAIHSFDDLDILPLSDGRVPRLLPTLNSDERTASIHVLHVDGRVDSAGRAATDLASRLSLLASVSTGSSRFGPARRFIEASYRLVARHRHHLARLVKDVEPVRRWRSDP